MALLTIHTDKITSKFYTFHGKLKVSLIWSECRKCRECRECLELKWKIEV